ncbi:MAG: HEAT repeat domain-containing protein [Candidatus Magnetominusculus sp. LBB02]|nr:HEAT repeat domain-containing protein [Candidatus Magnetominusculus sp. LBB02]
MLGLMDARALYPLIKMLSDGSPAVVEAAMQSILKIGGEAAAYMLIPVLRKGASERNAALLLLKELGASAVPLLYSLLDDRDENMRKFALDLLGDIAAGVETDKILPALKDPNTNVRAAACRALGLLRTGTAHLIESLNDVEWVAFAAIEALGAIGGDEALMAISNLSSEGSSVLQCSAIETMGKIPSELSKETLSRRLGQEGGLARKAAFKSLISLGITADMTYLAPELLDMLKDGCWEDKMAAVKGLRALCEKGSVEAMLDAAGSLDTSNIETEGYYDIISDAIADMADCDTLTEILAAGRLKVRAEALLAEMLGKLKCNEAIEPLIGLLGRPHWEIRKAATSALVEIADDSAIVRLIDALKDEDCHVKRQVVYALRKLGNKKAFIPILDMLDKEKCDDVIDEALKALVAIDLDKFQEYVDKYPKKLKQSKKLKRYIAEFAVDEDVLLGLSEEADDELKITALRRLALLRNEQRLSERVAARLAKAVKDPSAAIRRAALAALTQAGEFSEQILYALKDSDALVRFHAVKALSAAGAEGRIDELSSMLKDKELIVVMGAIEAIGAVGGPQANEILKGLRNHPDVRARAKAEEMMQTL